MQSEAPLYDKLDGIGVISHFDVYGTSKLLYGGLAQ